MKKYAFWMAVGLASTVATAYGALGKGKHDPWFYGGFAFFLTSVCAITMIWSENGTPEDY